MKRFLAFVLVALAFTFVSVAPVSHAVAAPVGDPSAGKPVAAMDDAMKNSKDTASNAAEKNTRKPNKKKTHTHSKSGHKKHHKKDTDNSSK